MKVAIVGWREYNNYIEFCTHLEQLGLDTETIISGGASGTDTLAARLATERGLKLIIFPANWKKYSQVEGLNRNKQIITEADVVVAFLHSKSVCTLNNIELAQQAGKPCYIINI